MPPAAGGDHPPPDPLGGGAGSGWRDGRRAERPGLWSRKWGGPAGRKAGLARPPHFRDHGRQRRSAAFYEALEAKIL